MNKKFWSGISTAALTTVFGTTVFLGGSQHQSLASNSETNPLGNQPQSEVKTENPTSDSSIPNPGGVIPANDSPSTTGVTTPENVIATIYSHRWKETQAVTLRVRNIPILTFLGPSKPSAHTQPKTNNLSEGDPVLRAKAVAARLNQLIQESFDARQITVSWDSDSKTYRIKIKDEALVNIDQATRLPDSTNNLANDALQMTNRLRRLMGDAPPLSSIGDESQNSAQNDPSQPIKNAIRQKKGVASWYGPGFHGRRTANGERYNQHGLTAAHRFLPFGTKVRVTNVRNGRSVIVRINDRGPFSRGRIIDLSAGAAKLIGVFSNGTATVALEVLRR